MHRVKALQVRCCEPVTRGLASPSLSHTVDHVRMLTFTTQATPRRVSPDKIFGQAGASTPSCEVKVKT